MATIRAGRLTHWLTFEDLISGVDSDGATVESWIPAFAVSNRMPADVTPLSGRELIAANETHSKVTHRIKVRFREGFKARLRAVERNTVYSIEAVIPDPDSGFRYLTLLASTGVSEL